MSDPAPTLHARIPTSLQAAVAEHVGLAHGERVAERLRERDATLWGAPGTSEVADRLGWLTIAQRMRAQLGEIHAFAGELAGEGTSDVVLLGMGGSSLAPEVLRRCFGEQPDRPRLHVLDSTDAAAVRAVQDAVALERTLFVVSSKSGGTIEPLSLFAHFFALRGDGRAFAAITDPGTGLERLAAEHGFRRVFAGDPEIGGRYSALSAFGIVPGASMGADVDALLERADDAWSAALAPAEHAETEPRAGEDVQLPGAVWLGCALAALARCGRDKLTLLISPSLPGLGLWLEQLVAESTGKHGTGILPVAEEPAGEPGEYGEDRVFAFLPDERAPQQLAQRLAHELAAAGHPVITAPVAGPRDLGRTFMLWEIAVATAGWGLRINPFDQPNVQQAKDATNAVLAQYESTGTLPDLADAGEDVLRRLALEGAPPEYVAIMAYARPTPQLDEAAAELRRAIRRSSGATTTFGYGPRFLHSTGQFHKGGPPTGRFLQLVHDGGADVPIPGRAYGFTTLKHAQALGDLTTLRALGRPAERVTLAGDDAAAAVRDLTSKIKEPA